MSFISWKVNVVNLSIIGVIGVIGVIGNWKLATPSFAQTGIISPNPATSSASPSPSPLPTPLIISEPFNLTVSPPVLNVPTEPGIITPLAIKIRNNSNQVEHLKIEFKKFKADETGTKPILQELGPTDLFPSWFKFPESDFYIQPNSWKDINFSFMPPENAGPSYYFAIIFNRAEDVSTSANQLVHAGAAVLFLTNIGSSRVYHQLNINSLTPLDTLFKSNWFYEYLPANFEITVQNVGNVHELAYGNIFIEYLSGHKKDVGILSVNPEKSLILPNTKRTYQASWTDGFPVYQIQKDANGDVIKDRAGQPLKKLKWDFTKLNWFRIGQYRAKLLLVYNDGTRDIPLESERTFWVIPWKFILATVLLIFLIVYAVISLIKKTVHKIQDFAPRKPNPPPQTKPY